MKALLAVALLFSSTLAAQQRPPAIGETIEVSIANVEVIVTDRAGNRVHGLKADDFEIRQDGKPQRITNFAEYRDSGSVPAIRTATEAAQQPAEQAAPIREPRTIVLFVEHARLPRWD